MARREERTVRARQGEAGRSEPRLHMERRQMLWWEGRPDEAQNGLNNSSRAALERAADGAGGAGSECWFKKTTWALPGPCLAWAAEHFKGRASWETHCGGRGTQRRACERGRQARAAD